MSYQFSVPLHNNPKLIELILDYQYQSFSHRSQLANCNFYTEDNHYIYQFSLNSTNNPYRIKVSPSENELIFSIHFSAKDGIPFEFYQSLQNNLTGQTSNIQLSTLQVNDEESKQQSLTAHRIFLTHRFTDEFLVDSDNDTNINSRYQTNDMTVTLYETSTLLSQSKSLDATQEFWENYFTFMNNN